MPRFFPALLTALGIVSLAFAVSLLIRPSRSPNRSSVILCLGDSMTEGDYGGYPVHLRRLVKAQFPRVRVYAAARPGHNTGEYVAFLRNADLLGKYRPGIVLLMLGTNDVRTDGDRIPTGEFERNLNLIIDRIAGAGTGERQKKPAVFLATIPPIFSIDLPNFSEESKRRIVEEINPAIRRMARDRSLPLVDVERLFMENRALLPGIHPVAAGYRRMAETFLAAIRTVLRTFPAD